MKAILLIAALFAVSSYASTIEVNCDAGEDRLEVYTKVIDNKSFQIVSLFGPSGLGPDFLIEQYVSVSSEVYLVSNKEISLRSVLPHSGLLTIVINERGGNGEIVYPNSKVVGALKNCTFSAQ